MGSLPTKNGTSKTATRGALFILNAEGQLVETLANQLINGPWDLATVADGTQATVFFTNVLNGTVKAKEKVVHGGTVVRMVLDDSGTEPKVLSSVVIASGYPERTDPAALAVGPTGVAVDATGNVFVADTVGSKIWEIPNALAMTSSLGEGAAIATSAQRLAGPLGLTIAPNGDLLTVNAANGYVVELSPTGSAVDRVQLDKSVAAKGAVPGSGALFGLVAAPNGGGLYFVDDATNKLDLLGP
ncbi:MAG TPA: hypothetical protein VN781_07620 [Acidimicrobiales bacterium]|nr:hypothetical protein [Acidimicrobiales bacterium]